ncbi:preQ(1) synthase [Lactobacillus sp. UCMA15818]|nr:preQ(1) synthase [Lactobacillus sp. UCMA15818]MDN2453843.1 preQ(1) synthase [Lactobacillus sp. UCMA15818]
MNKTTSPSRKTSELEGVTQLGNQHTSYPQDYTPQVLETFINKHPENDYLVTFDGYEFTSLCPKTGQPDFANVFISYIPTEKMVESKSLKLYLFSFRNHGDFHEDCMNIILDDLYKLMNPKYIEVFGLFTPRGGISIYPFVNRVNPSFSNNEIEQLAFQRKLQFLGNIQNYGRSIR